jgi:hypothetical protein
MFHLYLCGGLKCYKESHDAEINSGPDGGKPKPPTPKPPTPKPPTPKPPTPKPPAPPKPYPEDDRYNLIVGENCDINNGGI